MNTEIKRYPFKFLDAYERDDSDFFFGRKEEIESLYKMVFESDLILVYGASGTGKTSLIQCGLASKFPSHKWLPLMIRRGNNLNEALSKTLSEAGGFFKQNEDFNWLHQDINSEDFGEDIPLQQSVLKQQFRSIYLKHFKPIYLIFDQFEELYVLGNENEQQEFTNTIQEILTLDQPVKIIISIREEYLGYLYDFEKKVPELLNKKLRVDPMNLNKIKSVLEGVNKLKTSNVHLKEGEEKLISEAVFQRVKSKENSLFIQLPYLQVFLDKLYLTITNDESRQMEATLTLETINEFGTLGDVLRNFLDTQVINIANSLNQKTETLWNILSPFVTYEGTKEPISIDTLDKRLVSITPDTINKSLQAFIKSRILRYNDENSFYEITHDVLAKQIHAKRSDEEIALLEVKRLISTQVALNPENRAYLTTKQLQFVSPYLNQLSLNKDEKEFINISRQKIEFLQKKTKRLNRRITTGIIAAFVLLSSLTLWAFQQRKNAEEALNKIELNQKIKTAEDLKRFGDDYWNIEKKAKAKEYYNAAKDSLGHHPELELYHELIHKIKLLQ